VLVDTGANEDAMTISSVDPIANTITFTSGMAHAHAVGVPVVLRGVSWTDANTGGSSHTYRVSAVSQNLAESAFSPSAWCRAKQQSRPLANGSACADTTPAWPVADRTDACARRPASRSSRRWSR
jgi:hypothetical protein